MKLHREGYGIMAGTLVAVLGLSALNYFLLVKCASTILFWLVELILLTLLFLVVQFFRVPTRSCPYSENDIVCPADGKVVVVEEVEENEFFKDKRIQISIFMSPLNVHANYFPIGGETTYVKYHPGLFLVAWHPKSSTDNERSTIVVKHENGKEILFRQIAGAVARRICYYAQVGKAATQGEEFGFIKFGSRIDVFLPLETKIDVKIGDIVKAKTTRLAHF
ncbi:MAG: phosphatidylserine decarboxylase family protein [Crocinitomicaceae bacterium]|jgi:phosphatidylserine decarboxylase